MILGYHVSISKNIDFYDLCKKENLGSLQLFSGSPRSYFPSNWTEDRINKLKDLNISKFVHINYFVNIANNAPIVFKSIVKNLEFCKSICATGLILHMGSHASREEGMNNMINNLSGAYKIDSIPYIILETTAGGGNKFASIEDMLILSEKSHKIKLCFDTAHMYANGIDKNTIIGLIKKCKDNLSVVHLNNPNKEVIFGNHLDRHNVPLLDGVFSKDDIFDIVEILDTLKIPTILETGDMVNDLHIIQKYLMSNRRYNE